MMQFNIHRFIKLARWSLTNDKGEYLKLFLGILAVLTLLLVMNTSHNFRFDSHNHRTCAAITMIVFLATTIIGPAATLPGLKNKNAWQTYLMFPASNMEKYLMRYSTCIIRLMITLAAFLCADLIQYVVNLVGDNKTVMFVTKIIIELLPDHMEFRYATFFVIGGLWLHSVYALSGTFFRSSKYAWILTTLVLIALGTMKIGVHTGGHTGIDIVQAEKWQIMLCYSFYGAWAVLNFWLSYKLFCRQQVIGRFVNY